MATHLSGSMSDSPTCGPYKNAVDSPTMVPPQIEMGRSVYKEREAGFTIMVSLTTPRIL